MVEVSSSAVVDYAAFEWSGVVGWGERSSGARGARWSGNWGGGDRGDVVLGSHIEG